MQRDAIPSLYFAPEHRIGVDWSALLDAIGTLQFDDVLQAVLSALIGAEGPLSAHGRAVAPLGPLNLTQSIDLGMRLGGTGDALTAIVRKHIQSVHRGGDHHAAEPLSRLDMIERCLADSTNLPRRELEVCARILLGLSSTGMAIDLGLSEATVKTYRKRAYQRLSIGCERELITWYLRTWASWQQLAKHDICA
jgi:DNA-binding CsgD family transcriptional regulator